MNIQINQNNDGFSISYKGKALFKHTHKKPMLIIGNTHLVYRMRHGLFKIKEKLTKELLLRNFVMVRQDEDMVVIDFENIFKMKLKEDEDLLHIEFECSSSDINKVKINMMSHPHESIYGCGEQYSELNLKAKKVPLWCQEQGVGRGRDLLTLAADIHSGAGGKWHTTYYPQPTFVSSDNYFCHVETSCYSVFDFTKNHQHTLSIWDIPQKIVIGREETAVEVIEKLSCMLGRQSKLPDWAYDGVWLGIQGGKDIVRDKLDKAKKYGLEVTAVWCQDWEGKRLTSFGSQLMWNWEYDRTMYPNLPDFIKELNSEGVKFLGYINPFLAIEKNMYEEASKKGLLIKDQSDKDYFVHITTFPASQLDLTNPETIDWIKNIIRKNMIDIGLSGWMADFGEYLPIDARLKSPDEDAKSFHNRYPVVWAKVNREAIEEAGLADELTFFSRAGYTYSSRYSPIIWAGDQNVDWSKNDGLASVIPAGLSLGFMGVGIHHSDIGGYTTVAWLKRSKELLLRWIEHSAFTPIMRTHEGNRPNSNWQFDTDEETLQHLAYFSRIHKQLKPYLGDMVDEYVEKGLPCMRHPYIHYENDQKLHKLKYQYLFGRDLMVAPVIKPNKKAKKVYLPDDEWVHLWTGYEYSESGWYKVKAGIGEPPVFYRKASEFASLLAELKHISIKTPKRESK